MKKIIPTICAISLALGFASVANAQSAKKYFNDSYIGVGVAKRTFGVDVQSVSDYDPNIILINGRIGTKFNNYFGAEVEVYTGIDDYKDTINNGSSVETLSLKETAGATLWGVVSAPFADKWEGSFRLGYGTVKYTTDYKYVAGSTTYTDSAKTSDGGLAAGLGIAYNINKSLVARFDYENINVDDLNLKSYGFSIAKKF
jgi:opacity protein-like surface antigen